MRFYVKKTSTRKKGTYLQIYKTNYVSGKGNRNISYQVVGYVQDLIDKGIKDPFKYAQDIADSLNDKQANSKLVKQIGDVSACKNVGYFLLKAMLDKLDIDEFMNIFTQMKHFHFSMSDFVRTMIYAQIVNPGSKLKAFENVIPSIYGINTYSYDQILDGVEYIGEDYQKYIELFNVKINDIWPRNMKTNFFDCTNYYFEIDLEDSDRQKGPSKEERHLPIIGQALLLDTDQIPLGMMMYPGNKNEMPYLRETIEKTKERYDVNGKIVQVADKGLNCARNIYAAVKEAADGYIFSKSIHGKNLNEAEKEWIILDDDKANKWTEVKDEQGKLKYKYKSWVGDFTYHFVDELTGEVIYFTVKEKRVVTYNPSLARKQQSEIVKEVEKAKNGITIKALSKEEFGDISKYVNFSAITKDGKKVKIASSLNQEKIDYDMKYAGYNLLVTSETNMAASEIYKTYHGLWRIEESFRIMKSYLEARPVFLQKQESIYGHFTICYLALTVLRLLELKVFNDELPVNQIVEFIRGYSVTDYDGSNYINNATKSKTFEAIKKELGLSKLGNLILRKRDIDLLLKTEL